MKPLQLWLAAAMLSGSAACLAAPPAAAAASQAEPAQAQAAKDKPLSIADLEKAFRNAGLSDAEVTGNVGTSVPLSPTQIRALRRYVDDVRRASAEPPAPPPKALMRSLPVTLEPGSEPHKVRLFNGTVTSIIFQDATGAPWPIRKVVTGNEDWTTTHEEGGNILLISPKVEYSQSNASILLDGAPAPVVLLLNAGRHKEADHRLDLVVQSRGPKAISISMDVGRTSQIPAYMIAFQDGVPPSGAVRIKTSGADGVDAWRFNGKLVLRSKMTLSSPAATRAIRSADGTYVFELDETPLAYLLYSGRKVRVDIGL